MRRSNKTQLRVSQKLERLKAPCDALDSPSMEENEHLVRQILPLSGQVLKCQSKKGAKHLFT